MKILTVSDKIEKSFFKEHLLKKKGRNIDLILACGDLPPYYLEYLLNVLNVPLFYVPGNHYESPQNLLAKEKPFASGCRNLHCKIIEHKGLLIGGFGGSMRYKKGRYLFSEAQIRRKVTGMAHRLLLNKKKFGRYIDILITHSPPFGIHDESDLPHQGFRALLEFIETYKPAYFVHGHTMPKNGQHITRYQSTTILNTNNWWIWDI
jgi:uncharacterized protein